jgi:hypothetical protein
MFHREVGLETKFIWLNISGTRTNTVEWAPEGGTPGGTEVDGAEVTGPFDIALPVSAVDITINDLTALRLQWEMVDEVGHFILQDGVTEWGKVDEDFILIDTLVALRFKYIRETGGIVIVGVLDIGGGGQG